MSLKTSIVGQFRKPSGLIGGLAGHVMARRASNRRRNRRTVDLMQLHPGSRVLEVGCGPGLALARCAETVTEGRIVGLDHSPVMIGQARRRLKAAGVAHRAEFVVGDAGRLAEWACAFDRIYSLNVIQFIADKAGFFGHVLAALDHGGRCFTTYQPRLDNDDPDGAARMAEQVERLMRDAGFRDIRRIGLDAGATPAICVQGEKPARTGRSRGADDRGGRGPG